MDPYMDGKHTSHINEHQDDIQIREHQHVARKLFFFTFGLSTSNTSENSIIDHFRAFDAIIVYPLSIQQHSTKTHNLQLRQKSSDRLRWTKWFG